jgi:hypothetical protein
METPVAEQQQLQAALDAALAATTDFGIRKLRDPRWQPAPDSEASAELASRQIRQDGLPWSEDGLRTPYALASFTRITAVTRQALGEAAFATEFQNGRTLRPDQASSLLQPRRQS